MDNPLPLAQFIEDKIKVLEDFKIYVTKAHKKHMASLGSEIQIDNYCRELILKKLS